MKVVAKQTISEFVRLFNLAGDSLIEASKMLVKLVAEDPDCFEKIIRQCPGTTFDTLESLFNCGRIGLDPRKMLANPGAARAVFSLPEKAARDIVEHGVPLVPIRDGKPVRSDIMYQKPLETLNTSEVRRAFAFGKVRTAPEQIEVASKVVKADTLRYRITQEGLVEFQAKCTFTAGELADIAREAFKASMASLSKLNNQVK